MGGVKHQSSSDPRWRMVEGGGDERELEGHSPRLDGANGRDELQCSRGGGRKRPAVATTSIELDNSF